MSEEEKSKINVNNEFDNTTPEISVTGIGNYVMR